MKCWKKKENEKKYAAAAAEKAAVETQIQCMYIIIICMKWNEIYEWYSEYNSTTHMNKTTQKKI